MIDEAIRSIRNLHGAALVLIVTWVLGSGGIVEVAKQREATVHLHTFLFLRGILEGFSRPEAPISAFRNLERFLPWPGEGSVLFSGHARHDKRDPSRFIVFPECSHPDLPCDEYLVLMSGTSAKPVHRDHIYWYWVGGLEDSFLSSLSDSWRGGEGFHEVAEALFMDAAPTFLAELEQEPSLPRHFGRIARFLGSDKGENFYSSTLGTLRLADPRLETLRRQLDLANVSVGSGLAVPGDVFFMGIGVLLGVVAFLAVGPALKLAQRGEARAHLPWVFVARTQEVRLGWALEAALSVGHLLFIGAVPACLVWQVQLLDAIGRLEWLFWLGLATTTLYVVVFGVIAHQLSCLRRADPWTTSVGRTLLAVWMEAVALWGRWVR